MNADDLAQEVRCLKAELRDMQNRFAEEGARLNTEIAFWKLKFYEACELLPDRELPLEYELAWIKDQIRLAREDAADGAVRLSGR